VDVSIKKVGQRDGQERFVLVNTKTRQVVTANDVSEKSIRRFFRQLKAPDKLIDKCLQRARERYAAESKPVPQVSQTAETTEDEDLLFELGLEDDED
jgi:hypothetical protein